jgi:hypothetical protein
MPPVRRLTAILADDVAGDPEHGISATPKPGIIGK